jgi:glutamate-1-semialdehyde 2,1-aminomutase
VQLADLLCELHPWAQQVRFTRTGGEAMAVAIRLARAATGRDHVAFCGYHGWHDWYLAANLGTNDALDGHLLPGLAPRGVPRGLAGTLHPFAYNALDQLEAIVAEHGSQLAAIVLEPLRNHEPTPEFLPRVRAVATRCGAVLVFDEITAGWRLNTGGVHLLHGVAPDVAVFGKAMSNGYGMAAVIGNADVMSAAQDTFISSTYWTERIGPVAALATIAKHRRCDVPRHLVAIGSRIQAGWQAAAQRSGLLIAVSGMPPLAHFAFEYDDPAAVGTLFTQELLARGFLANTSFYATYAHRAEHVTSYLSAVDEVFHLLARAIEHGQVHQRLQGPVAQRGFCRLT